MQALMPSAVLGIDVSHYQGNIDFTKLPAQGIRFMFVKATEGATYVDPMFSTNVSHAKSVGLHVGLYHFAQPNQSTPEAEAANFIKAAQSVSFDLYPVLDLEAPSGGAMTATALVAWVLAFEQAVTKALGKKLMLYTGKWFADQYNGFNGALSHMPLWYASYTSTLADFGGFTSWACWQYTDSLTVAGIQGAVDADHAVSLEAIGYVAPAPQAAPAVTPKTATLSADDANYIIKRWIGNEFDLASADDQTNRHRLANILRVLSGQQPQ